MRDVRLGPRRMHGDLPREIVRRRGRHGGEFFAGSQVDQTHGRGEVLGDERRFLIVGQCESARKRTGREAAQNLSRRRVDLDQLAGIFQRDPHARAVTRRDDGIRFVSDVAATDDFAFVGIDEHDDVVRVNRNGELMRLTEERHTLWFVANGDLTQFGERRRIDDRDGAAIAIRARQQFSVGRDVKQTIGRSGEGRESAGSHQKNDSK